METNSAFPLLRFENFEIGIEKAKKILKFKELYKFKKLQRK